MVATVTRGTYVLRAAASLSGGAFAVHQLRYRLGFGDDAERVLHEQGHGYLTAAAPLISLLLAAVLGQLLWALGQPGRPVRVQTRGRWLAIVVALLAIYTVQELLEGALAAGHPAGFEGLVGHGGWTAVPLALFVGAAIALGLRVAGAIEAAEPLSLFSIQRPTVSAAAHLVAIVERDARRSSLLGLCCAGPAPPRGA